MSEWNYVATAHKPTAVTHSCVGHFTSPEELNLIVAKCTQIEIHIVNSNDGGLEPFLDVPIYGRIVSLELFCPKGEIQDLLFITTERHEYCVLKWDAEACKLITRLMGDVSGETGHPMDNGQIGIIDPDVRLIGLHLYDGLFKVIPFGEEGKLKEAFSIRFESQALDMKFLYGCPMPTVVVLYQDSEEARHARKYVIPLENDPNIGSHDLNNLDSGAYLLIPMSLPPYGVLIIGEEMIAYCDTSAAKDTYQIGEGLPSIRAYDHVGANQYVLGDHYGVLHHLNITHKENKFTGLTIKLGETSIPSTISHLCDSFVYIGSSYGDSQLAKFSLQPDRIEVLNRFDNLGPIGDFCIVDCKKLGQRQVVTCSGADKDGSLRIARNRFGMHEHTSAELQGIIGMWSLHLVNDDSCEILVISLTNESTLFFKIEPDDASLKTWNLVEDGFNSKVNTLACHDAEYNQLVQVTPKSVRLVSSISKSLKSEWVSRSPLTVAAANLTQVLLATGGQHKLLIYLTIEDGSLKETAEVNVDGDVSCLDITPIAEKANCSKFAAVGLWHDKSVNIYSLPGLHLVGKEILGGVESLPRSVLMCSLNRESYLFCGLADGHLMHFELNMVTGQLKGGELLGKKKLSIGTQPVTLCAFLSNEATHIFAASNTSMVIYNSNKKIFCCEVNNLNDVRLMTPCSVEAFPNSFAIAKGDQLAICNIDERQKLHIIRSEHLGERALHISHQEQSHTIAICTVKREDKDDMVSLVQLFDDQTYHMKTTYKLKEFEHSCSLISCSFSEDDNVYYCVGTAYLELDANECTKGRILVLQVVQGSKLQLVAERETDGAVYCLSAFIGQLLAAINQNIMWYKWASLENGRGRELESVSLYPGSVLCRFIQTRGPVIVVGDAMRSISLLRMKVRGWLFKGGMNENYSLAEQARDCNVNWMSAVEILSDKIYLGARNSLDLFTVTKQEEGAESEEERELLEVVGMFHLGEFINRFRHGLPVTLLEDSETIPSVIFGTVNGVIGVIASLPQEKYNLLEKLQSKLREVINGVGGLRNEQWRSSRQELRTVKSRNFLDGDLIESFLTLNNNLKKEIAQEMEVESGKLVKVVEELTHLVLVESFSL
ncbi:hypothetical protein R3W88_013209 [Solanum pinnatisectum]|uniref:DNA damage-binding protein 1 n=1 Tax=Solanum pinnatisectum TaxID=50273 RepID=A0AAV9LB91_9SOLN|nr:hypothetical protein R3W88_013209 [Solanum pinnatisectum]